VEKFRMFKVSHRPVFMTGGTGYVGQRLAAALVARGHRVRVLTRPPSVSRVAAGAEPVVGDALDASSYVPTLTRDDTLVHLVGTAHPSPAKAAEFQRVDLPSIQAAVSAARSACPSRLCQRGAPGSDDARLHSSQGRRRSRDRARPSHGNRASSVVCARPRSLVAGRTD